VVTTSWGLCLRGAVGLVCEVMARRNRVRAGQIGCAGTWLVCSLALGSPEALGAMGCRVCRGHVRLYHQTARFPSPGCGGSHGCPGTIRWAPEGAPVASWDFTVEID
jgi:hypothetical protein